MKGLHATFHLGRNQVVAAGMLSLAVLFLQLSLKACSYTSYPFNFPFLRLSGRTLWHH